MTQNSVNEIRTDCPVVVTLCVPYSMFKYQDRLFYHNQVVYLYSKRGLFVRNHEDTSYSV
jgi:hypothetical protein